MSTEINNTGVEPNFEWLTDAQVDITGAKIVSITIRHDKKVVWVNVDGICVLRVCQIEQLKANVT